MNDVGAGLLLDIGMLALVVYTFGVAFILARAVYRSAGLVGAVVTPFVTLAAWYSAPALCFLASLPVLCWLRWLDTRSAEPLPRAKVV